MKPLRGLLTAALCTLIALPVWAAIEISETVDYVGTAAPDTAACAWEASMVSSAIAESQGAIKPAGKTPAPSGPRLSLQVTQLKLTTTPKGGEYSVVTRGNVIDSGKLLATRDFAESKSFKTGQPPCEALRALGASLGEPIGEWASTTKFMECRDDCVGIHPDEPIVIGSQVLAGSAEAINDTVRDECKWPTAMVSLLVKTFNAQEPLPRAKLESRAIDIEKYPGRRLLLRVSNVHAIGGGGWSGPKWMTLTGELWDGKSLVGSFSSYSSSGRGLTTCRSVDSLSEDSAELISRWLRSPSIGANLK